MASLPRISFNEQSSSPSMSPSPPTSSSQSFPKNPQVEPKHCWVCFANEDDDYTAQWASPCKCRGTAKWVHKACLQRWIDEKQQGNASVEVSCPQCNSAYIIVYPKSGLFVKVLDMLDHIICKACPFLAGGILVGSVYWTAVTYGAVTIMQVLGHKEGLTVMEKADPLIMLIGLPTIPVMLMLGRLIRWEDAVLKFWRKHSTKLPLLSMIFPNAFGAGTGGQHHLPRTPNVSYSSASSTSSDPVSFTRTICGGLILPTIATIFGKLLFQRVNSNFQRSIIGGIAFIGLKGIFKIYYKQQQFLRQAHRQIKNYETIASMASASSSSSATPRQHSNNNNLNNMNHMNNSNNTSSNNNNNNERNSNNIRNIPFLGERSTSSNFTSSTSNTNTSNVYHHNQPPTMNVPTNSNNNTTSTTTPSSTINNSNTVYSESGNIQPEKLTQYLKNRGQASSSSSSGSVPSPSSSSASSKKMRKQIEKPHVFAGAETTRRRQQRQKSESPSTSKTSMSFVLNDVLLNDDDDDDEDQDDGHEDESENEEYEEDLPSLPSSSSSSLSHKSNKNEQQKQNNQGEQRVESDLEADLNESLETFANEETTTPEH